MEARGMPSLSLNLDVASERNICLSGATGNLRAQCPEH